MSQVSRPMQIALAVTLLFALVWFVALRPKPAGGDESAAGPAPAQSAPAAPGTDGLTGAVEQAQGAVTTASGDAGRAARSSAAGADAGAPATATRNASPGRDAAGGGAATDTTAAGSGSRDAAGADAAGGDAAGSAAAGGDAAAAKGKPAASPQVRAVRTALRRHKAVAIAFVDPHTADARAVAGEMRGVSRFGGRALALSAPLARLSDFAFITDAVEVTVAPTIVIVDPRRRATTIVGFADRGEIEQRLADALAVKPRR